MVQPVTVGLDIAKNVFHAYGVNAQGEKAFSRKLRRGQVEAFFAKLEPCLVGIEACARRITGRARSRSWGITSGSCRRQTSIPT
jgi:transposase